MKKALNQAQNENNLPKMEIDVQTFRHKVPKNAIPGVSFLLDFSVFVLYARDRIKYLLMIMYGRKWWTHSMMSAGFG